LQHQHHLFQRAFFPAQFLGAFGVVPDFRVFQFQIDDDQAFVFLIVVKDTSGVQRRAPPDRPDDWRCRFVVLLP
jgi:hypothetical protein